MFERYTEKARRVIFFARYEASQFGSPYIESEHLLLGLLREDKTLTHRFLASYSSVELIRKKIESHTIIREKTATSVDLALSNECKRILAYAGEEAERLSHKHIGTEHLLLGLLREENCFAAQLLRERGIEIEDARNQIAAHPRQEAGTSPIPVGYAPGRLLYNPASETLILEARSRLRETTFPELLQHIPFGLPDRLFVRPKSAQVYERLGNPPQTVSYESPVTCEKHPIVMFNSKERSQEGSGKNWAAVYAYNLTTKEVEVCISKESLAISEPHLRAWVAELVSLSDDAQTLYLNIVVEKEAPKRSLIEHHLASFSLATKKVELLVPLREGRF